MRQIFLDEFLGQADLQGSLFGDGAAPSDASQAIQKARAFYDRVLVGYGDDSVAQLGGAHIACEEISNVAAKILEDARIGIAPLEKSTRYVRFDSHGPDGDYLFHKEPTIMGSSHREAYLNCMRHLFETYAAQIEPMIAFVRDSLPSTPLSGNIRKRATPSPMQRHSRTKPSEDGPRERIARPSERTPATFCGRISRQPP